MAKGIKILSVISLVLTLLLALAYCAFPLDVLLSLAITFGTTTYHFLMRLFVGWTIDCIFHNRMDHRKAWFQPRPFEKKLYQALRVKQWKGKMPTYEPGLFSPEEHSLEEIVGAMCQAELVHEVIVVLSFLPLTFTFFFGAFPVFLITSVLAACFDLLFVIMQRYNRPRLVKILERQKRG